VIRSTYDNIMIDHKIFCKLGPGVQFSSVQFCSCAVSIGLYLLTCVAGATGASGASGQPGTAGFTGRQGAIGDTGPSGTAGPPGPLGATGASGNSMPRSLNLVYLHVCMSLSTYLILATSHMFSLFFA